MLLGILLHGLLSFVPIPIWPAQDIHQYPVAFGFLQHAIHGFRMPLFFLLSGFFTAMLWQRRGLKGLWKQRLLRIGVPLLIGTLIVWPTMAVVGAWGAAKKATMAGSAEGTELTRMVREETSEQVREYLEAREVDLDGQDGIGITPLGWAALEGKLETAVVLLDAGADLGARNSDGSTPLHAAAFLGRTELVTLFLDRGADVAVRNHRGMTALDSSRSDEELINWVGGALQIEIEEGKVREGRRLVAERLARESGEGEIPPSESEGESAVAKIGSFLVGVVAFGAFIPVFQHLWFLNYLLWLVAGFTVVAFLSRRMGWLRFPAALVTSRWRAVWFVPLVLLPQLFMVQTYGADTASGLLPWPPKLAYYAVFFAIGALLYSKGAMRDQFGRRWAWWGAAALPVLGLGLFAFHRRIESGDDWIAWHIATCVLAVVYAWLMIAAMIGLFRWSFPSENKVVRYLSDSAYFLYLAHLPLIIAAQIWVSDWDQPAWAKFGLVTLVPTVLLIGIYQVAVRYTFVGAVLNGRRRRPTADN